MKFYINILNNDQKNILPALSFLKKFGFVLYGGTAVALRYGHRSSIDFDFMSSIPLTYDLKNAIKSLNYTFQNSTILQDSDNTLTLVTENNVKISLFGGLTFGRIGNPDLFDDDILLIASSYDLLMTKLKVILQRSEIRDYIDIAEMLSNGLDLSIGLSGNITIYNDDFSSFYCLKALTFFYQDEFENLEGRYKKILIERVKKVNITKLNTIKFVSKNISDYPYNINN